MSSDVKLPIYMDHNATTPVDGRVFEVMRPWFCERFGNAASRFHSFGERAREAVETAREQVARLIGARAEEIVWTSGATESDNLAIKGAAQAGKEKGRRHIVTQVTEHKAVLDTCKRLEKEGYEVTYLPVARGSGRVSAEQVREAIRTGETALVSIMWANNETGTMQPVGKIGAVCREQGVVFHTDATQAMGKVGIDAERDGVDLMSFSAHKMYGPKGCGGLYVRKQRPRVQLAAQMDGGGHERGFRSGTLNVPGIVGLGAACEICGKEMEQEAARERELRDRLEKAILERIPLVTVNGDREHRLPQTTNLSFAYVEGESILLAMNDVALSSGSACTSESLEPSYVLRALGVDAGLAHSSIRFSLGRWTTEAEVDYVVRKLEREIGRLREMSPLYEMAMEGVDVGKVEWKSDEAT
jgi:cysteine desulfurase